MARILDTILDISRMNHASRAHAPPHAGPPVALHEPDHVRICDGDRKKRSLALGLAAFRPLLCVTSMPAGNSRIGKLRKMVLSPRGFATPIARDQAISGSGDGCCPPCLENGDGGRRLTGSAGSRSSRWSDY